MNILVISHTYIAKINRDKWKSLATLYPNCNITVIIPQKWPTYLFIHEVKNLDTEFLPNCSFIAIKTFFAGNEVLYFYHPKKLFQTIKRFRPDIIHIEQGDNALSYFQAIIFSKIINPNVTCIFFTWINWHHKFSLKYRLTLKWIEKINLKLSNGAIVGNHDAQKILTSKGFIKPTLVLPQLGVNLTTFIPKNKNLSKKTIGYIGRLVDEKGIELLIDAFALLEKTISNWTMRIIGGGPMQKNIISLINNYHLQHKISLEPPVTHHDVANILPQIDILVLPSYDTPAWKEQFGHIIIEAMACAIPVIGSSAGEIPNVIKDAGIIFEQKNLHSLLESLKTLMQDEQLREQIGTAGLKRVNMYYSHQAVAKATYQFWQSFL